MNQGRVSEGRTVGGKWVGEAQEVARLPAISAFHSSAQPSPIPKQDIQISPRRRGSHIRVSPFWSHPNVLEFTLKGDTGPKRSKGVRQHRRQRGQDYQSPKRKARQRSVSVGRGLQGSSDEEERVGKVTSGSEMERGIEEHRRFTMMGVSLVKANVAPALRLASATPAS